jgi:hypothetical protein
MQLCATKDLGFSCTTGADTYTADASTHTEVCSCGRHFDFDSGQPIDQLGDMTICPACLTITQWHKHYRLDLTPLWLRLRNIYGWDVAREQCDRAAQRWGIEIGALHAYITTPSLFLVDKLPSAQRD